AGEFVTAAVEPGAPFERITRVDAANVLDRYRFVRGCDGHENVAVAAPEERPVDSARSAVEHVPVAVALDLLSFDLVAITLQSSAGNPEGFAVFEFDRRASSTRGLHLRESRGQSVLIKQHADRRVCG